MTKLLKCVSGFLGRIWYQRICHPFRCVNVPAVPAVAPKPHTLSALSPRSSTQSKPRLIATEDPFISRLAPNQWHFPSQMKSRTVLLLSEPTSLPLQPNELHHPVVVMRKSYYWRHRTAPPGQIVFFFRVLLSQFGVIFWGLHYWQIDRVNTAPVLFHRNVQLKPKLFHVSTAGSCSIAVTLYCCWPWRISAYKPGICVKLFCGLSIIKTAFVIASVVVAEILVKSPPCTIKSSDVILWETGLRLLVSATKNELEQPNADVPQLLWLKTLIFRKTHFSCYWTLFRWRTDRK